MNLKFKADYYTNNGTRCKKGEVYELTNQAEIDLVIRIGYAVPFESPKSAKEKILAMETSENKNAIVTKEEKANVETKGKRGRPARQ